MKHYQQIQKKHLDLMQSPFEEFCVFAFVRFVCIFDEILKNFGFNVKLCDSVEEMSSK